MRGTEHPVGVDDGSATPVAVHLCIEEALAPDACLPGICPIHSVISTHNPGGHLDHVPAAALDRGGGGNT